MRWQDQAIRGLPKAQQRWVAKTEARFLPYGTNMNHWNLQQEDQCPRCYQSAGNKNHITQCHTPHTHHTHQQWDNAIDQFNKWLQQTQTDPKIQQELMNGAKKMAASRQ